jgi:hemerythrin-like domain-containing protein
MKRHPALHDLARDHHHALVHSLNIKKAETIEDLKKAALALVRLWRDDLVFHFREEEEVLLPLLSRHQSPSENTDVRCMLDDHAFLRDGLRRLERALASEQEFAELARELGRRLEQHARLEDRIVFGYVESLLTDVELDELAELSARFRRDLGRPMGA